MQHWCDVDCADRGAHLAGCIRADLVRARARGFAQASEEDQVGVIGFACAIEYGVQCFGAVAIAMPTVRYKDGVRDPVIRDLMRVAGQLSSRNLA